MFGMPPMIYLAKINPVYQQNLAKKKLKKDNFVFLSKGLNRIITASINLKQKHSTELSVHLGEIEVQ